MMRMWIWECGQGRLIYEKLGVALTDDKIEKNHLGYGHIVRRSIDVVNQRGKTVNINGKV